MQPSFVHLHLHTEFSLIDGIVRIKPLAQVVAAANMPAVAITDQSNLFGMVKFYRACQQAGIKPILGIDVRIQDPDDPKIYSALTLLCENNTGYNNVTRLISRAYIEGQVQGLAMLQREWLDQETTAGVIALSGGRVGDIGQSLLARRQDKAQQQLQQWLAIFGQRFYLELQRTGRANEDDYLQAAVDLALANDVAVVATNDVHFLTTDDFEAHEARVCIHEGVTVADPRREQRYSPQQYLRTPQEMAELFADLPEALENTVEIAKMCNVELTLGKNYLPDFPVPDGMTMAAFFCQQAEQGLVQRLLTLFDANAADYADQCVPYHDRLKTELDVINSMGFAGYFLIVADFIKWAKDNAIPVGPGRGSGAGSLVAYALTITDLDPIAYELLFERFLNPERVSMPDFDVDFCMEGRDRVIDYVATQYGRDKVSQIITYGTMAAKAVVRDVGRVLGHPYGFVDRIAKLIPFELGITLDKALAQEEALQREYEEEDDVKALIDLARKLEGVTRNAGKHAGGVVIAPSVLTDFSPLYCEAGGGSLVTQFDKDDVEAVGLVKFDFLGLRTLTIIDWALQSINKMGEQQGKAPVDLSAIALDDVDAFALLKRHQTTAVFQLESRGMKELIKRLQPDSFEEIIALVALFRPGPLQSGMVDDFINCKHGRQKIEYPHPDLAPILQPTYGIILYQEQVMQIAQVLAGYTLGGADLLRRAMGKKKLEEMAKQREIFVNGATERGVKQETATYIFDLMEKFAGYGFNKSHSAAYALVSYQTAWLKAHYPAAFMAAVLSADMDNTDKVVALIDECRQLKLTVNPPNINGSVYAFSANDTTSLQYGLGAIKGLGEAAVNAVLAERDDHGKFSDLFDFCQRIDSKKVTRRSLETLIRAGVLDALGPNRATLMASLNAALKMAEQYLRNHDTGQSDMFGLVTTTTNLAECTTIVSVSGGEAGFVNVPVWSDEIRLQAEKETLGFYLTGHPIDRYLAELSKVTTARIAQIHPDRKATAVVGGLVMGLRFVKTRRNDRMAILTLNDQSASIDVTVFADLYQQYQHLIALDRVLVVSGEVAIDDFSGGIKMSAKSIQDMEIVRQNRVRRLLIRIAAPQVDTQWVKQLSETLTPFRDGSCPVYVDCGLTGMRVNLSLSEAWKIRPCDQLMTGITQLPGTESAVFVYD